MRLRAGVVLLIAGCKLLARKEEEREDAWVPSYTMERAAGDVIGDVRTVFRVEIAPDGSLRVDGVVVADLEEVTVRANAAKEKAPNVEAHIHADDAVPYRRVVEVRDAIAKGGVSHFAVGGQPKRP